LPGAIRRNGRLVCRRDRPAPAGNRLLPLDLRLPRAGGGRREVSGRISQAGRPPHHEGNTYGPVDRSAHPAVVPRMVPRRGANPVVRDGQRSAKRWRRLGHERGFRRVGHLSVAFPGPDRFGAAGIDPGQMDPLSHRGCPGRKRPGSGRLRQQGVDSDDRRLCPGNARGQDGRSSHGGAPIHSADLRTAGRAGPEDRRPEGPSTKPSGPRANWPEPRRAAR